MSLRHRKVISLHDTILSSGLEISVDSYQNILLQIALLSMTHFMPSFSLLPRQCDENYFCSTPSRA